MTSIVRLRELDSRAWSTATWAAPLAVQLVLGAMVIALVLLGKVPAYLTTSDRTGGPAWFLGIATATVLTSALVGGLLFRSRSPRVQGIALSIAGSAAVALIGVITFALWVIRW